MIQLQNFGILLCIVLAAGFLASIPWAIRADRADAHMMHEPGKCPDGACDDDRPDVSLL